MFWVRWPQWLHNLVNILKTTVLHNWKGWTLWYMNLSQWKTLPPNAWWYAIYTVSFGRSSHWPPSKTRGKVAGKRIKPFSAASGWFIHRRHLKKSRPCATDGSESWREQDEADSMVLTASTTYLQGRHKKACTRWWAPRASNGPRGWLTPCRGRGSRSDCKGPVMVGEETMVYSTWESLMVFKLMNSKIWPVLER